MARNQSYMLVVGNVGTVFNERTHRNAALKEYNDWIRASENDSGSRAYGEDVTLFEDGEILREHSQAFDYAEEFA
jgi:hypothetical protein